MIILKNHVIIIVSCVLVLCVGLVLYQRVMRKKSVGRVVVFDGASSAGKSSVIKELMPLLDNTYERVAIDDFVTQVFIEQQKLNLPEKEFLARISQQSGLMYNKIKILVTNGKNVILDTVLSGLKGEESIREQLGQLKNMSYYLVLVHCPLSVLVDRIKKRNEQAVRENKPEEERHIGQAIRQFGYIYCAQQTNKQVSLGTLSRTDVEFACELAKKEWGGNLSKFDEFKGWLLAQLGLKDKDMVTLTTRLTYDVIVDTSTNTPQECAQKIKKFL